MKNSATNGDASSAAKGDATTIFDYFFASYVTPQIQRLRSVTVNGVQHASEISPRDPLPGQPVAVSIITNAALPIDRVAVYFTADGSEPDGERGQPARGHVVLATRQTDHTELVGDTPVHRWQAWVPGQPDGVLVRYRIDAWCDSDATLWWLADVTDPIAAPVRSYLIEVAQRWLRDSGADGLRLDNVSGPAHAFWTVFQEGIKAHTPDALTLAEVSGDMGDIVTYGGRLDACMDFPLAKITRRVFAQRSAPLDELLAMLEAHEAAFAPAMARARLLDNHDMHRFLWLAENDTRRLKLALTFLMVLPGFPVLYYGTEAGLSQRAGPAGKDAYAREPMPWGSDQQTDVLQHARWLIARRAALTSLRHGQLARVPVTCATATEGQADQADQADQVGALVRWTDHEASIIAFNNSDTPARITVEPRDLPFAWETSSTQAGMVEAWLVAPDAITRLSSPSLTVLLPPLSAAMFLRSAGG